MLRACRPDRGNNGCLTFLSPLPALIAAAIAVPALVVFYLLKLRRRPIRVSSTLLWMRAVRDLQVNVPLRWLRPSWLFFLQFLILALFLLALARPAVDMAGQAPAKVALLIDRSASMSARDGNQGGTREESRLDAAKERALRTLEELARSSPRTAVGVVAFAAEPRLLTGFTTDRGAARAAILGIEPSDQPGDVGAALRLAGAVLSTDAGEEEARQRALVVMFSDGGSATAEGYALAGAEFRYERIGPEAAGHDNLGVVALAARRDWDDPASVRIFARIQNAAAEPIASNITLSLDDKVVESRPLVIPGAAAAGGPGSGSIQTLTPSQFPVTFRLETRESGVVRIRIERADLLDSDNSAAVVLTAATKPRIQLVIPDAAPPNPGEQAAGGPPPPQWFISSIIQEMGLPLRIVPASVYERDAASGEPSIVAPDLVIFDRVRPRAMPVSPSLSFGAGLPAPGLDAPAEPLGQGTYVVSWMRSHPALRHVALDTIFVSRPLRLAEAGEREGGQGPVLTELARGAAGPLMVMGQVGATRHIVVGFALADSNWPLHVGFPIFIASAIDYLTLRGEDRAGRGYTTAEPVEFVYAGPRATITLQGPATITAEVPAGPSPGRPAGPRAVNLGLIERAGVYALADGGPGGDTAGADTAIAVNLLDEGESALAVRGVIRVGGDEVTGQGGSGGGPREIWPWLVLAALVLLSVEWFVSAWLMRA